MTEEGDIQVNLWPPHVRTLGNSPTLVHTHVYATYASPHGNDVGSHVFKLQIQCHAPSFLKLPEWRQEEGKEAQPA